MRVRSTARHLSVVVASTDGSGLTDLGVGGTRGVKKKKVGGGGGGGGREEEEGEKKKEKGYSIHLLAPRLAPARASVDPPGPTQRRQRTVVRIGCRRRVDVEVLLDVHRNRRFIRDGSPGRPPPLSHSS